MLHYGKDFGDWQRHFLHQLQQRRCGITILRGEPGTGKTTYLKYLTRRLRRTHRFYYLPLTVFPWLSNPSAVDFWLNENAVHSRIKKVVILEDAESLLMQRAFDNQADVSSLLNISDGFFGDVLNLHIICTINSDIEYIDPAITRPGRLLAQRTFARLSASDAQTLATAKGLSLHSQADYSLGDVYCSTVDTRQNDQLAVGFCT